MSKALLPPDERRELRRQRRKERLDFLRDDIVFRAAQDVKLKKYMFLSDAELKSKHFLTDAQISRVRQWESPKKEVAFGIEGSQRILETMMKAEVAKPKVELNVENMTIQLPEKRPEAIEAVVVEVDHEDSK